MEADIADNASAEPRKNEVLPSWQLKALPTSGSVCMLGHTTQALSDNFADRPLLVACSILALVSTQRLLG